MMNLELPWWEFIFRAIVVYIFLLIGIRLSGRRQAGELSAFDLVLLLIISEAVQNSMNGGDNSLIGGIIIAITLFALHYIVGLISFKNKKIAKVIDGKPLVLIHNGRVNEDVLRKEMITNDELYEMLRTHEVEKVEDVRAAIIEPSGEVSVFKKTS